MSKYCSPYAQRCQEECCDKYGECPEYSGRKCRYYYKDRASASDVEGSENSQGAGSAVAGGAAGVAAGSAAGGAAGSASRASNKDNNLTGDEQPEAETNKRASRKGKRSHPNKDIQSGSSKQVDSEDTEAPTRRSTSNSRSAKSSNWSLPSPFTPGSSVNIIFWTLLGIGSLMFVFLLYCCFCRRRTPMYYNPGAGGIPQRTPSGTIGAVVPGAANMGAYGQPAMILPPQAGFGGNMVQATPVQGPLSASVNPTYTTSTLRLSRTAPNGVQPVRR